MSNITYIRFFASDWLSGTRGMTAAETGIYITLCAMMYERSGPLRDDPARLARLCGASNSTFQAALEMLVNDGKIIRENGELYSQTVHREISYVMEKSGVARDRAANRWSKKQAKSKADECTGNADAMLTINHEPDISSSLHSDDINAHAKAQASLKPEKTLSRFDEFWRAYPKRDGSNPKEPARQKFEQACKRGEDPQAIIDGATRYAEQQARLGNIGTPYVKQAATWLNAKGWTDEYVAPPPPPLPKPYSAPGNFSQSKSPAARMNDAIEKIRKELEYDQRDTNPGQLESPFLILPGN